MDYSMSEYVNGVSKRRSFESAFGNSGDPVKHSSSTALMAKKFRASTCCPTYHNSPPMYQTPAPQQSQPQMPSEGVFTLYQDHTKFHVTIKFGGQSHYLGVFGRREDASQAYAAALRANWHLLTEEETMAVYQRTVLNADSSGEVSLQLC
jgi:hypothetical protein